MKKLIILLCLAILATAVFASCTPDASGDCEHTLLETWESNETSHWHPTECEHGEFRSEPEAHVDADEDGFCDLCSYESKHTHTYASEWSSNSSVHWKVATCTHEGEHTPEALHVDDNGDGFCDVCGGHSHVLDPNGTGRCTLCNTQIKEVDTSEVSSVIAALVGGRVNVKSGTVVSLRTMREGKNSTASKFNTIVEYFIGENCIYNKSSAANEGTSADREGEEYTFDTKSISEKWVSKEADGTIFGAYRETTNGVAGKVMKDAGASEDSLLGYYYSVSTHASGYGAEGILKTLYEKSQSLNATDYVVEEGENSYKFSYNYTIVNSTNISDGQGGSLGVNHNVQYFEVSVEFSYDESYTLTNLEITCDCYTSDAGVLPNGDKDEANVDLDYDPLTGVATLRATAKADTYSFIVEQTSEGEDFVNPYGKDYFIPKGFQVYSDAEFTTLCPDTVTISLTNLPEDETSPWVRFYLADGTTPFTSGEGVVWESSDNAGLWTFTTFSTQSSQVRFMAKAVGTYTATISYAGVTKTFTVIVTA